MEQVGGQRMAAQKKEGGQKRRGYPVTFGERYFLGQDKSKKSNPEPRKDRVVIKGW